MGPRRVYMHQNVRNVAFKVSDKLYLGWDPRSSFFSAFSFSSFVQVRFGIYDRPPGVLVFCSFHFFLFSFFLTFPSGIIVCQIFNVLFITSTFQNTLRSRLFSLIEMIQIFFSSCRVHTAIRDNKVLDTPPVPDNQHKRIVAFEDILKV